MNRLKQTFKQAFNKTKWAGLGVLVGGVILPRLFSSDCFNFGCPVPLVYLPVDFAVGFLAGFLVYWLVLFIQFKP